MKPSLFLGSATIALAITLAPARAQDGEDVVIVTGSPLDRTQDDLALGASVLSGDDLARQQAGTIGETLRNEPGLSATGFGAGASRPIIRGQGGDRIRILDNGIGSIDASAASPDHAVAVEPAMAERIEIIRGTGLLRYGSSGAGGVVNVIDGRIPREAPEDGVDGAFRVGASSVDEGTEAAGGVTLDAAEIGGARLVLHADGAWREANDYDIPGHAESSLLRSMEEDEHEHEEEDHEHEEEVRDTLGNSFVESWSAAGGASLVGERGFIGLAVKTFKSEYGIPGGHEHAEEEDHEGEEHEEEEEGGVSIDLDQTRYDLNARYSIGGAIFDAVALYAGYADYEHSEIEPSGDVGTTFANEGWEARAELIQSDRGGWRGATGLHRRERDFSAIGEEAFVPPTSSEQSAIYTFQEFRTGPWLLEAAARLERTEHRNSGTGQERGFDGISGSLGANIDLSPNIAVAGTVFRTERAPTTEELFSNGPHLATSQFELGDATLDEEIATGVEAIFHLHGDRGFATLNLFHTDYDRYIYEAMTGEEDDGLPVYAFTAADATFKGFEAEVETEIAQMGAFTLTADGVLDLVDATLSSGEPLPRIPPLGATIGLEAAHPRLTLRGEIEHAAEADDVAPGELPTDSYTLLNAYVSTTPFAAAPNIELRLSALNLTDEEARLHTSFLKDQVPLPGRNFRISVTSRF